MVILFLGAKRFFVRDEIPFFWKQPVLALAKHQVATDLGRLEACLRTDTKMETQDRKSHEAYAGCAFLVINNFKDRGGLLPTPVVALDSFGLDDDRGVAFLPCLRTGGDRACHVAARHGDDYFCNFFLSHNLKFTIYDLRFIDDLVLCTIYGGTIVNLLQLNNQSYLVNRQIVNSLGFLVPDLVALGVVIGVQLMHRIAEERTDFGLGLELRL